MRFVYTLALASLIGLASVQVAQCQTDISTDTTINTDRTDMIVIHNGTSPAHQTTVNIVDPAYTHKSILVQDTSILNIQGGTVFDAFALGTGGTINVSGGHLFHLGNTDDGAAPGKSLNISGGTIDTIETQERVVLTGGTITTFNGGFFADKPQFLGGTIQNAIVYSSLDLQGTTSTINTLNFGGNVLNLDTSTVGRVLNVNNMNPTTVNILGGSVARVGQGSGGGLFTINMYAGSVTDLLDASTINFYGGHADLLQSNNGPTNMYGGSIRANSFANAEPFNFFGGTADYLFDSFSISGSGHNALNMYGGSVGQLRPFYDPVDSIFNIYGGSIGSIENGSLFGTFNFFGPQLAFDGSTVAGILADGSVINLSIPQGNIVHLAGTPEPGALGLLLSLGLVGTGFWARRRRK